MWALEMQKSGMFGLALFEEGALILHRVDYGPVKGRRVNTAVCAGGKYVYLGKQLRTSYFSTLPLNPHIRPGPYIQYKIPPFLI